MNHPSEWIKIYHPQRRKYVWKHKGTAVFSDSLFKIGKPLIGVLKKTAKKAGEKIAKKAGEKIAKKTGEKIAKKAGNKIGEVLRKRKATPRSGEVKRNRPSQHDAMVQLNQLISRL